MKRKMTTLLALALAAALTSGCSATRVSMPTSYATAEEGTYQAATTANRAMDTKDAYEYEEAYDGDYTDDAAMTVNSTSAGSGAEEEEDTSAQETGTVDAQKLVYHASIRLETTEFDDTVNMIRQSVEKAGGFIESESSSDGSSGWYMDGYRRQPASLWANLHVRVPSAEFQAFLGGLEGEHARVKNRSIYVENISRQYSESQSYIAMYEAQEKRLLELTETASEVSDILEIENRLAEVQRNLKSYKDGLASMDTDVAYSIVDIDISEVGIYTEPEATTFSEKVSEAFQTAISNFSRNAQNFAIWAVGHFPGLLITLLIFIILILVIRKIARKRQRRRAEKEAAREAEAREIAIREAAKAAREAVSREAVSMAAGHKTDAGTDHGQGPHIPTPLP